MKKTVAIIPARGGSKGIPRKNIKELLGKPLIAYTIEAAIKSGIDRVIVSTDDAEIAKIAEHYGAEVPFLRPEQLAEDTSSSLSVIVHAIEHLEKVESYFADTILFLQPTSPLRTCDHIMQGLKMLEESSVDSIVGVRRAYEEHPYFMFKTEEDGTWIEYEQVVNKPARRQDVPPCYLINASLFISKRSYYNEIKPSDFVFNLKSFKGLEMDRTSSLDINEMLDFLIIEKVMETDM